MKEAKLSSPVFEFNTFFTVAFKRPKTQITTSEVRAENFGANFGVKGKRLERMVKIMEILLAGDLLIDSQISLMFHVTARTIENDMQFLRKYNLIEFMGASKNGKYVLTERGKNKIMDLMK